MLRARAMSAVMGVRPCMARFRFVGDNAGAGDERQAALVKRRHVTDRDERAHQRGDDRNRDR